MQNVLNDLFLRWQLPSCVCSDCSYLMRYTCKSCNLLSFSPLCCMQLSWMTSLGARRQVLASPPSPSFCLLLPGYSRPWPPPFSDTHASPSSRHCLHISPLSIVVAPPCILTFTQLCTAPDSRDTCRVCCWLLFRGATVATCAHIFHLPTLPAWLAGLCASQLKSSRSRPS